MTDLLPLTFRDAKDLRWQQPATLLPCAHQPLLPVQANEAGRLAGSMPLALIRDAQQTSGWSLVAVCGKQQDRNLYFDATGRWLGHVPPVSLQHFPFVLIPIGDDKALPCFDKRSGLLSEAPDAQPFFDAQGQLTGEAKAKVEALVAHHPHVRQTQRALATLSQAKIITPWPATVIEAAGVEITGLYGIDEKALQALSDETFIALRAHGALTLAYAIAFSLNQLHLLNRLARINAGRTPPTNGNGELDLEFLNDGGTINFGTLQ